MSKREPPLFKLYPKLKKGVPWLPILTNVPTPVDRLANLENHLEVKSGAIYIKRDDKDHHIYGGNKLRKFEFIFGEIKKRNMKGVMTGGGIGTNHGLACAIVAQNMTPPIDCHLFLHEQPLTFHVQRSLLLYNYFGARLHLVKGFFGMLIKMAFMKLRHPKYFFMLPGGSPAFGIGTPLGTIGFINAIVELKNQIDQGILEEPDSIFLAGGSAGTAAGLICGCKLMGLNTVVNIVPVVSADFLREKSYVIKSCNKAIKYLKNCDKDFPSLDIQEEDFNMIEGYIGSNYGIITEKSQQAVDLLKDLEGKEGGFRLDTTYTGKAMAAMIDYLTKKENKSEKVLFWNTYNSNDLTKYLKETEFNYKKLPEEFHKFFEEKQFQCWQIVDCPKETRENCPAYLNHDYRFWKVTDCKLSKEKIQKVKKILSRAIRIEESQERKNDK
ncbi:MAG: pyridoxal-phosphate dependent enzyme [Candidatus Lokiarchaeota archaeon]|nr:pyridoxal-phosphate dependent enzyme [Candidatus Lokiarchaeota archaeon]MBD3337935.1 pyridoxal-phosphate dependent enzyme [Candidatus Lokiarchaeota archaeon]